jgi:hypothetical protein
LGEEESEDTEESRLDDFVKTWSWIYVVYQMAEFYPMESVEDQYKKKVKRFLNDMAFMRDKNKYDLELDEERERIRNGR